MARLIETKAITQKDLAERADLSPGHISNLIRGSQVWVAPEDLSKICRVLSDDVSTQASLLKAHLLDECEGNPAAELIKISIVHDNHTLREAPTKYRSTQPEFDESIQILQKHQSLREVQHVVIGLAKLLTRPN